MSMLAFAAAAASAAMGFPEWSPAVFTIPAFDVAGHTIGPLPLRWYAIGYIVGIGLGFWYMHQLARRVRLSGSALVTSDALDDLLFWAIIGIILGGRLGYVLFYLLPFTPQTVLSDPMILLRIWDGGMSFHGGLLGVIAALIFTARKHNTPFLRLTDLAACAAPIGIGLVRVANFANAELYGRVIPEDGPQYLGVIFPEGRSPEPGGPPEAYNWASGEWVYLGNEVPRYPSQLYEAFLEGLLLFMILVVAVWVFRILRRPGLATGVFLIGYGLGRTIAENFREPDGHIGFLEFLPIKVTMGMVLSAPMYLGGAYLVWRSLSRPPPDAADGPSDETKPQAA